MRHPSFIGVVVALVVLAGLGAGVVVLDHRADGKIANGVRVGGVDVGGLSPAGARARLERELLRPVDERIVVHHGGASWHLSAQKAKIRADLNGMVDEALRRSDDGSIFVRAFRELTGGEVAADVAPRVRYSRGAVKAMIARVQRGINRKAINASVKFSATGVVKVDSRTGLAVQAERLKDEIDRSITDPGASRRFVATTRKVRPKVTTGQLEDKYPVALIVDRAGFRLHLYRRLERVKTYGIAVGKAGLETPAGLYNVQNKAENPAWHVPDSDWAGKLAGKVIPGGTPENPIKARWLGVYDGVGVHGTGDPGSIGTAASHGCIRMRIPEVIELYPQVPVGAPIYIA